MKRRLLPALLALASLVAVSPAGEAVAAQTTFYRYSSCTTPPAGSLQFRRAVNSSTTYCTHAFGADSWLRSPGTGDTFWDGYYLGTEQLNTTNTHALWNKWSVALSICIGKDYFVTRNTMAVGAYINTFGQTTGLMSYRASNCIND